MRTHAQTVLICFGVAAVLAVGLPGTPSSTTMAQTTQAPGGFLEKAGSTIRPRWSNSQVQAVVPADRGKFIFPAPYNTQGVRITSPSDCPNNSDCLWYVGYSYWRNTNNHVGSNTMLIFLSFDRVRGGAGPTLFSYDKTTDIVTKVGPLFDTYSKYSWGNSSGWYFSATRPTTIYIPDGPQLLRYEINSKQFETVLNVTTKYGTDRNIFQVHSSNDDSVHSATLQKTSTGEYLGCVVYLQATGQFQFYPKVGTYDECQIDKSGRYVLIKELITSISRVDNRIIDVQTGAETRVKDGATSGNVGHSDMGFGYLVGLDPWNNLPNAAIMNLLSPYAKGPAVNANYDWHLVQELHLSHLNAKAGTPIDQQYACGSNADRMSYAQNEIVCFRLNNSLNQLVVAPVMTDLNAGGGGDDYAKLPKGNIDITGQYFIWTSNVGTGRLEAFVTKIPYQVLFGQAPVAPPSAGTPPPGKKRHR